MSANTSENKPDWGMAGTFAALKHPNYRLWFTGQLISLVGSWMQSTAQGYLIYELTGSSAYLGYVGFASGVPTLLFTLVGGVVADRISKRKLLIITQISMMLLAAILATMVFLNIVQPWHILVLAFFLGIANAFDAPARQSFIAELVERKDLTNAIALNASLVNMGIVVGPAVAGLVYAWVGPAWCFSINSISFMAIIYCLTRMKMPAREPAPVRRSAFSDIREGFLYIATKKLTQVQLAALAVVSSFGFSMLTLLPAWAVAILGGDVRTNGLLLSSRGVGSLIGALFIAWAGHRIVRGKFWTVGSFFLPLVMLAFSQVRLLAPSMLLLVAIGFGLMLCTNLTNAMVQTDVDDRYRGRVMSMYTLVLMGSQPLGSLMVGLVANGLGEPTALIINAAVLMLMAVVVFTFQPMVRSHA